MRNTHAMCAMQDLASAEDDQKGPIARSKRGRGAPPPVRAGAAVEPLFVLSLHESHTLDAPDARVAAAAAAAASGAGSDPFAGMQQVGSKQQWKAPPLPMCAALSADARSANRGPIESMNESELRLFGHVGCDA